jgi:hypothetical protein
MSYTNGHDENEIKFKNSMIKVSGTESFVSKMNVIFSKIELEFKTIKVFKEAFRKCRLN